MAFLSPVLLASVLLAACNSSTNDANVATSPQIPTDVILTPHFLIHSAATPAETQSVSKAAEILYTAYVGLFPQHASQARFEIVLYRDQSEFKRHNRTQSWAEAYYLMPRSFAYPGSGANPHHWMNHEITHQLLRESSGYRPQRWLNEGIATYFSSSVMRRDTLQLGVPDPNAYPVWWLSSLEFLANAEVRFQGKELIPLQELVEGTGPAIGTRVNNYYVASWSLVHFLMEGDDGRYRSSLLKLVEQGGLPADFNKMIGSYAEIEPRWHAHLMRLKRDAAGALSLIPRSAIQTSAR